MPLSCQCRIPSSRNWSREFGRVHLSLSSLTAPSVRRAVVVLHPTHRGKVSQKDLQDHVARLLPKHCVPVLIVFKDEMPRLALSDSTSSCHFAD